MRLTFRNAAAAAAVVVVVGTAYLAGTAAPRPGFGSDGPSATPVSTASPSTVPTASEVARLLPPFPGRIDLADPEARFNNYTVADRLLTSRSFGIPVRFWLDTFGADASNEGVPGPSDWCSASADTGLIVLPWAVMCHIKFQFIHPASISCGIDGPPTAERVVAALIANRTLGIEDLGNVRGNPEVSPGTFVSPSGRLLRIKGGTRNFDTVDPDRCTLHVGSTTIEIRHDVPQDLIVQDVGGEIVILRLAAANDGQAAKLVPSGYFDLFRDAGAGDPSLMDTIHDISFE